MAILGTPCKVLLDNPIFQGNLKSDSLYVGEDLAQKALTAEKIILLTAEIPTKIHFKYTGRSQFPHFAIKPLIRSTEEFEHLSCQHYPFWALFSKFARKTQTSRNNRNEATISKRHQQTQLSITRTPTRPRT